MAKKIAKIDADAMNSLYGSEVARLAGRKVADEHAPQEGEAGYTHDPQAFKDHEEYLGTLKSILSDDGSQDHDPNDPIKD
jgi:hypothetical protein